VNSRDAGSFMTLGQIAKAQGIRGWLLVRSFTDPPETLLEYEQWQLVSPSGQTRMVRMEEGAPYRDRLRIRLDGVSDRDEAQALSGWWVQVARSSLSPLGDREHYRDDLVGFEVKNLVGALLGVVDHFIDTPGNTVMVIQGEREHLVPVTREHLRSVDKGARSLVVDWPEDF